MQRSLKRLLSFFVLVTLGAIVFSFVSCNSSDDDGAVGAETEQMEKRYVETEYPLPDDCYMVRELTPRYDTDSDTVTVYAQSGETLDIDGKSVRRTHGSFYSFASDGTVTATLDLTLPDNTRIVSGVFSEERVYYITYLYDRTDASYEYHLNSTIYQNNSDTALSDTAVSIELSEYFNSYDMPSCVCVDKNDNIYIAGQTRLVCLRSDMTVLFDLEPENYIMSMVSLRNGTVGICSFFGNEVGLAILDESGRYSKPYPLTEGTRTLLCALGNDDRYELYFADSSFVWGASFNENGGLTKEPVMKLSESGILNADTTKAMQTESSAYPVAAFGENFMFAATGSGEYSGLTPYMYSPSSLDDASIQTITVAYAEALPIDIADKLAVFQRQNKSIRIETKDYSIYSTPDDKSTAHEQLAFDIVNGICSPDIVIGQSKDTELLQLIKNKLYVDLVPYLASDDTINSDTLFGCIKRSFDDGDGGMWGICRQFTFRTIVSTREMLGEYVELESWTIDEMLDFLESLPEDVERMSLATRESSDYQFLCNGYGMFIDMDNAVCSFDSDTFKRYLSYVMTLPQDAREARSSSNYLKLSAAERYHERASGRLALEFFSMWGAEALFEPICLFGTHDYVPIGLATNGTSGTQIRPTECFVITTFSDAPDLCFELIKSFFTECGAPDRPLIGVELYSLKPQLEGLMDYLADYDIIHYFDGAYSLSERDPSAPLDESSLSEPGMIVRFTEEDGEKLVSFLDRAGYPLLDSTPEAVNAIIDEETSALFAGHGTVEECADRIQSRVSIWLSENLG